jgi:hypothetical protein
MVLGVARVVGVRRFLLLEAGGVLEDDPRQLGGVPGAEERAVKPVPCQGREVTHVIEMGMGDHDRIDRGRIDGERHPDPHPQLLLALEQPASTSTLASSVSSRNLLPVTVPVPPRNCRIGAGTLVLTPGGRIGCARPRPPTAARPRRWSS